MTVPRRFFSLASLALVVVAAAMVTFSTESLARAPDQITTTPDLQAITLSTSPAELPTNTAVTLRSASVIAPIYAVAGVDSALSLVSKVEQYPFSGTANESVEAALALMVTVDVMGNSSSQPGPVARSGPMVSVAIDALNWVAEISPGEVSGATMLIAA